MKEDDDDKEEQGKDHARARDDAILMHEQMAHWRGPEEQWVEAATPLAIKVMAIPELTSCYMRRRRCRLAPCDSSVYNRDNDAHIIYLTGDCEDHITPQGSLRRDAGDATGVSTCGVCETTRGYLRTCDMCEPAYVDREKRGGVVVCTSCNNHRDKPL